VVHLDAAEKLQHRRAQVLRAAVAGGAEVELVRMRFRVGDQLLHGIYRQRGRHHQQELDARDLVTGCRSVSGSKVLALAMYGLVTKTLSGARSHV
jgi:hypothetical protein